MDLNPESKRHFLNKKRRLQHLLNESNYLNDLPDSSQISEPLSTFESFSLSFDSSHNSSHDSTGDVSWDSESCAPDINENQVNELMLSDPSIMDYAEVSLTAILSYGNLTLNSAEKFVNIVNNFIGRFCNKSIKLPNVRSFWVKQVKDSPLNVYILCENQHSHGPFTGEPRHYGIYNCSNNRKKAQLIQGNNFIHIPLRYQLTKYLPYIRESMWIDDFLNRNIFSDSYSNILELNLTLHADEVMAFNSSSVKIFPIFATINQLKAKTKRRYFFLISLYVGSSKPNVNSYLNPICSELKDLAENPVQWKSIEGIEREAYFRVSAIIADSPMRAYLRNVKQYNHLFGCDWCRIKATSSRGARVYPNLDLHEIQNLKRFHKDFVDFQPEMNTLESSRNSRFRGIFGVSPLLKLPGFDIVDGFAVEPMHCMILGVFRAIVNRGWLAADSSSSVFSRSVDKNFFKRELSSRIMKIKVPSHFIRSPRSLDLIKFWKSNEIDCFLCYYFLASIRGLLQIRYINHILCLMRIYYLSHRESTSIDKIREIRELVNEFQHGSGALYGSQFLSYNLHIMTHLADSCKNLGPTCSYSSYPLENNMGILKNNVRRASNIAPSLVRIFLNKFRFNDIINSKLLYWNLSDKEIKDFGSCAENLYLQDDDSKRIDSCNVIPSRRRIQNFSIIQEYFNEEIHESRIKFFESLRIGKKRFSTDYYCLQKKRDDSHVKIGENEYLQIQHIFSVDDSTYYCIGKKFKTKPFSITFDGFTKKINVKLEYVNQVYSTENDSVCEMLESKMIHVILVKSTEFYYMYKNDYIIEPYLLNY